MGTEGKYGRITTEFGDIPDDEPVFLLRARDAEAVSTIQEYRDKCSAAGSPLHHLVGIEAAIGRFTAFRAAHPDRVQVPQSADLRRDWE